MQNFFATPWPHPRRPAVYFRVPLAPVARLREACLEVVSDVPVLRVVAPEWLHATVTTVPVDADTLTKRDWEELVQALVPVVAGHRAFAMSVGPAVVGPGGVVFDMTPDSAWNPLVRDVSTVIPTVLCVDTALAIRPAPRPHFSLAYSTGQADDAPVQARLRRATDLRPVVTVERLSLVNLTQDPTAGTYTWRLIADLPLSPNDHNPATEIAERTVGTPT